MAELRVAIHAGARLTLCRACEAELGAVPCSTCGAAAGGACARCGERADPASLARVPHAEAIGVYDEGTFGPRPAA